MSYIPWYVTLVRLIVPILILRFPLLGMLSSILADASDWYFIGVTSDTISVAYQKWDKMMDLYSYLFIAWIVLKWQDIWAKKVALGFFAYRMFGEVLFQITGWRPILFFFPNVFENFVIVCLIIFWLSKKKTFSFSPLHKTLMLSILIVPKMIHEYFLHVLSRQPWEIYNIGSWLGFKDAALINANSFIWISLLYVLPIGAFLLYTKRKYYLRTNLSQQEDSSISIEI